MKKFFRLLQDHSDRLKEQIPDLDSLEALHEELGLSISPDDSQFSSIAVWKLRQDLCQLESR